MVGSVGQPKISQLFQAKKRTNNDSLGFPKKRNSTQILKDSSIETKTAKRFQTDADIVLAPASTKTTTLKKAPPRRSSRRKSDVAKEAGSIITLFNKQSSQSLTEQEDSSNISQNDTIKDNHDENTYPENVIVIDNDKEMVVKTNAAAAVAPTPVDDVDDEAKMEKLLEYELKIAKQKLAQQKESKVVPDSIKSSLSPPKAQAENKSKGKDSKSMANLADIQLPPPTTPKAVRARRPAPSVHSSPIVKSLITTPSKKKVFPERVQSFQGQAPLLETPTKKTNSPMRALSLESPPAEPLGLTYTHTPSKKKSPKPINLDAQTTPSKAFAGLTKEGRLIATPSPQARRQLRMNSAVKDISLSPYTPRKTRVSIEPPAISTREKFRRRAQEAKLALDKQNETKDQTTTSAPQQEVQDPSTLEASQPQPETKPQNEPRPNFVLPKAYEDLLKIFTSLDLALRINKVRNTLLCFKKAKVFIENSTRIEFTKKELGQIKAVYPDAYTFNCIKCEDKFIKETATHTNDLSKLLIDGNLSRSRTDGTIELFSHSRMEERKRNFRAFLQERLFKKHEAFVLEKEGKEKWGKFVNAHLRRGDGYPIHPAFFVNRIVTTDDIVPAKLPEIKKPVTINASNARAFLQANSKRKDWAKRCLDAQDRADLTPPLLVKKENESPLSQINAPIAPTKTDTKETTSPNKSITVKAPKLTEFERLKARIMTKEMNAKIEAKMLAKKARTNFGLTSTEAKRISNLQRLPRFANIIHSMSVFHKGDRWPMKEVIERIHTTYQPKLQKVTILESIELLPEVVPEWISLRRNDLGRSIRLQTKVPIKDVLQKISDAVDKEALKQTQIEDKINAEIFAKTGTSATLNLKPKQMPFF